MPYIDIDLSDLANDMDLEEIERLHAMKREQMGVALAGHPNASLCYLLEEAWITRDRVLFDRAMRMLEPARRSIPARSGFQAARGALAEAPTPATEVEHG